jgi:prophage regulatory protein
MKGKRLIRLREVKHRTGLSRSLIYQKIAQKTFPGPVPIAERAVAWVEEEIQDWIDGQIGRRGA